MNKYTFATQKGKAYYCNSIPGFIHDKTSSVIGQLVKHSFEVNKEQSDAWENQISGLQDKLEESGIEGDIIFEYDIVRLGKRIDVVMLIKHMVFSLEFKNGKSLYLASDAQQAEDYAIDIKNFHKESEDLYVCPILVATDASNYNKKQMVGCYPDKQIFLQRENMKSLVPKIQQISNTYGDERKIDFKKWFNSPYYPTPTIISAAVEAYNSCNTSQIANSEAGQNDIDKCEKEIFKIIEYAKTNRKKCICFVTGVPGAGKTLVGLNLVAKSLKNEMKGTSVYLSGNGPLVEVLREAIYTSVKDKNRNKSKRFFAEARAAINALIQNSFAFKKDNANNTNTIPEKILIFDEAQRIWDREQMIKKHSKDLNLSVSEPYLLYQIMDRREDWGVIVCLVGLGQDIHDGEVGINEWFRCGIEDFKNWEMFYSDLIFSQIEDKSIDINSIKNCDRCKQIRGLHLKTAIRSFRANRQSQFVDNLLGNNCEKAKEIYSTICDKYPIYITRDISTAKKWARSKVRGSQRCGVLASSNAQRLKPDGIYVPTEIDVKKWFLAPSDDLRSSNMMEIVASEFKVQGLEVDWAVVCWDADLRRNNNGEWDYYRFRGTKWERRLQDAKKRHLINSYRVLLTRARQGMIIFVPKGVSKDEDATRDHKIYDDIYDYLLNCGIKKHE